MLSDNSGSTGKTDSAALRDLQIVDHYVYEGYSQGMVEKGMLLHSKNKERSL